MPRLPSFRPRHIAKFLKYHGFALDHASGSHFVFYNSFSGKRAVIPRHNRDVPKGTLLSLLKEAGFTREEIIGFFVKRK